MDGKTKLTITEAAEYLGTHRIKINRLIHRGILTAEPSPINKTHKLIDRTQLDQYRVYESQHRRTKTRSSNGKTQITTVVKSPDLTQILERIRASEAEEKAGVQILQQEIKQMVAQIIAAERLKRELGESS